jgi:hypothetical protein
MKRFQTTICTAILLSVCTFTTKAQNLDIQRLGAVGKNKFFVPNGGVNASTIFYSGNGTTNREPFTYYLNGSLNIRVAGLVDLPFSFNISNAGGGFSYPVAPSQLSLHPKYKSVTAHIGDITMFFSPYTLNGHQFRGAGVDVESAKSSFKVSAMAGRLQKAVAYDSTNLSLPAAYQRFGYGAHLRFEKRNYKLGMILFAAKDRVSSLDYKPDSVMVLPRQNLVASLNATIMPLTNLEIYIEYAASALTRDLRDSTSVVTKSGNLLGMAINERNSTSFYKAYKTNLSYRYKNSIVGVGFEHIDPGYETLGAYYFNNDLENITVNFGQSFFKDKGRIDANVGYQHDDLDGHKTGTNKRNVVAINMSFAAGQKLLASASYSNFTTFMNIKPLFHTINQLTPYQNPDTLNFSQVSQNANFNVNYMFQSNKKRMQGVNMNLTILDALDKQGGVGSASRFYTITTAYTMTFIPTSMSITTAFNASFNRIGGVDYRTLGPTAAVRRQISKKMNGSILLSFNHSVAAGAVQSTVFNSHIMAGYRLSTRQSFSLTIMDQAGWAKLHGSTNDLVVTAGYNYIF